MRSLVGVSRRPHYVSDQILKRQKVHMNISRVILDHVKVPGPPAR